MIRAAALLAVVLLGGCASVPKVSGVEAGELLSGRLSVRVEASAGVEAKSLSAAFELAGTPESGRLDLSTPLGTVLARARWQPGQVRLSTPEGDTGYADLDMLTRELLGEALPVAALFDWLQGRPWPGAASTVSASPTEPGFAQLGWAVNLARFDEAWVLARRERAPAVTVRAKLDRP